MTVIRILLILVEVVTSTLLIGVIFLQKSKGSGMGMAFGGVGEAIFGTRMGNVLTKATVILGVTFLVNTTLLAWIGAQRQSTSVVVRNPVEATYPAAGMPVPPDGGAMPVEGPIESAAAPSDSGAAPAAGTDAAAPASEVPVVEIPAPAPADVTVEVPVATPAAPVEAPAAP